MCWNAEISLKTFIVGTISALICLYLNTLPTSLILITWSFTFMQLIEYFAWIYINNPRYIYYISIISLVLIFLQLFVLCYYVIHYQKYLLLALSLYVILICIFVLPNIIFNIKKGKNGHLEWEWLNLPPFFLFFGLILYCLPLLFNKNYVGFAFTLTTILISLYNYNKYNTWGTMWCYFSNFIWAFFVPFSLYRKFYSQKVLFWNH